MITYAKTGIIFHIGRVLEQNVTEVRFDVTKWKEEYGINNVTLLISRNNIEFYPRTLSLITVGSYTYAVWPILATDTEQRGPGWCQLQDTVTIDDTEVTFKSPIYEFAVLNSIDGTEVDPPQEWENWVVRLTEAAEDAAEQVDLANIARIGAETAEDGAQVYAQAAESAVDHYPQLRPSSTGVTWWIWDGVTETWRDTHYQGTLSIFKTYATVNEMEADYAAVPLYSIVMVNNRSIYIRSNDAIPPSHFIYCSDMSGLTGNGISYIEIDPSQTEIHKPGTMDSYIIHYTSGNSWVYQVYNGDDGADGEPGATGPQGLPGINGDPAGFGTQTAIYDGDEKGESPYAPYVTITPVSSSPDTAKEFIFHFGNLKGAKGDEGPQGPSGPGTGDMLRNDYDATGVVRSSYGIPNYVANQLIPKITNPISGGVLSDQVLIYHKKNNVWCWDNVPYGKADWQENDSTSPNYIANRPGAYTENLNIQESVITNTGVDNWYRGTFATSFVLMEGTSYTVNFESVEYNLTAQYYTTNKIRLVHDNFIIETDTSATIPSGFLYTHVAGTYNISISGTNIVPLPYNYVEPTLSATRCSLLVTGWGNFHDNKYWQTVSNISGVKSDNIIFVSPQPSQQQIYGLSEIVCEDQGAGSLIFSCTLIPSVDIAMNIVTGR